jgi:hypothetical protein
VRRGLVPIALVATLAACGGRDRRPAQDLIDREKDPEARRELEAVRDATERDLREREAALDREIEALRKENAELREKAGK